MFASATLNNACVHTASLMPVNAELCVYQDTLGCVQAHRIKITCARVIKVRGGGDGDAHAAAVEEKKKEIRGVAIK